MAAFTGGFPACQIPYMRYVFVVIKDTLGTSGAFSCGGQSMKCGLTALFASIACLASMSLVSLLPATAYADANATHVAIAKLAPDTPILVMKPEVTLNMLTAGGTLDPKDEWSHAAQGFIAASLATAMTTRHYVTVNADADSYQDPHAIQVLKLNDAVTQSITMNEGVLTKLPTKPGFDWTVGDDVSALQPAGTATPPAYALFIRANGVFSSGGRAAAMIGMALVGVSVPMGGQTLQGTLVDLKTGQVVWYQTYTVPAGVDIRKADDAGIVINAMLKKLPL